MGPHAPHAVVSSAYVPRVLTGARNPSMPPTPYPPIHVFQDYLDQVGLTDLKDRRKKEKEVDLNSICVFEEGEHMRVRRRSMSFERPSIHDSSINP